MSDLRPETEFDRDLEFRRLWINARRAENALVRQQVRQTSGAEYAAAAEGVAVARNDLERYEHEQITRGVTR